MSNISDRRFAELLAKFGGRLQVRIVCAWCGVTLLGADTSSETPISHGICKACSDKLEAEET